MKAPEYSKKERIILVAKMFAWVVPAVLFLELWFRDWLSEYTEVADCYFYGSITGMHLIFYGVFVGLPIMSAIIVFLLEGRRGIKIIKLRQNPLPGEKVLRPTEYKYGNTALIQPTVIFAVIFFMLGMSVWGSFQAEKIVAKVKPCESEKIVIF